MSENVVTSGGADRRRIMLDIDRCIDCHACAAACYYHHHTMPVIRFGTGRMAVLPAICRQCLVPSCVDACPNGAMFRDSSGAVIRSTFSCTGCGACVVGCPFGVLDADLSDLIPKCDHCTERTREGHDPWCVASCSSGALYFIEPHDAESSSVILLGARIVGRRLWGRR